MPPMPGEYLSSPLFDIMDLIKLLINMGLKIDPDDRPGFNELTAFLRGLRGLIKEGNFDEEMVPEYEDDSIDIWDELTKAILNTKNDYVNLS